MGNGYAKPARRPSSARTPAFLPEDERIEKWMKRRVYTEQRLQRLVSMKMIFW
jgi:hypothetical protein